MDVETLEDAHGCQTPRLVHPCAYLNAVQPWRSNACRLTVWAPPRPRQNSRKQTQLACGLRASSTADAFLASNTATRHLRSLSSGKGCGLWRQVSGELPPRRQHRQPRLFWRCAKKQQERAQGTFPFWVRNSYVRVKGASTWSEEKENMWRQRRRITGPDLAAWRDRSLVSVISAATQSTGRDVAGESVRRALPP